MTKHEQTKLGVGVKEFRLLKFDGEKLPGDGKRPVEILVGGDGRETKKVLPGEPEYEELCQKEGV